MTEDLKKIIIFSEPIHADKIADLYKTNDILIISFSIKGKLALAKRGITCYFPDDLIELPDLNQIGIDNYHRVKNICDFLDEELRGKIPLLKENNIKLFGSSFFTIKVFFDSLYTSYSILSKLFTKLNNCEIIAFKKNDRLDSLFEGQISIIPALIENVFLKRNNRIKIIVNDKYIFKEQLTLKLRHMLKYIYHFYYLPLRTEKRKYSCNGLLLQDGHDIPYVVETILNDINFFKIPFDNCFILNSIHTNIFQLKRFREENKGYCAAIKEVFDKASRSKQYHKLFGTDNDLIFFANKCLEKYFLETVVKFLPYLDSMKKRIANLSPKVLLTASCRLDLKSAFFLEIVRSLKIPIVAYQEGGGTGYLNWPLFNIDLELSDYFLVYGNGVKERLYPNKGKSQIVPVGSLRLEKIKKNIKNKACGEKIVFVILDNLKLDTWQHYPYNGNFFSRAYRHQLKILDILRQFKDVNFVIKTTKERELLYESYRNFFKIETKPLIEVISYADAFILEFPSTVLQECLLTDKPIGLLYDSSAVKFEGNALQLLNYRVRTSSVPEQFNEVIKSLIEDIMCGSEMINENTFRDNYCLMENTAENLKIFFDRLLLKYEQ